MLNNKEIIIPSFVDKYRIMKMQLLPFLARSRSLHARVVCAILKPFLFQRPKILSKQLTSNSFKLVTFVQLFAQ